MKRQIKKGELATQQIVMLIILIASFAIILFFLVKLNLGQTTEKELCHNSVVTKGSSILPEDTVPLDCKRTYLCITKDGSCEQMTKPDKQRVSTEEEVYEVLAKEMADCWWMFGEGKINYIGEGIHENLYCSICTQVAFDNSVGEIFTEGIIYEELLYAHMEYSNVSNLDKSYLEYLYNSNNFNDIKQNLESSGAQFGTIDLNNQHYVMMGITNDANAWIAAKRVGTGGAVLGLVWGVSIPGAIIGGLAGGVAGGVYGLIVQGVSGKQYLAPSIIEANSEEFENLECNSINTLA